MLLFTYGTLKKNLPNHHYMQKYQIVGGAKTSEKYPLINGTSHKCPFLLNKPGTGLNVLGEVYDIGDDSLCLTWSNSSDFDGPRNNFS